MASSKDYLEFILEQLSGLEDITYKTMMGEYILYYRGKIVGGIYDDRFLVKPVSSALALMPDAEWDDTEVVTNAALVKLTGKKESQKDYQRYSGYRDGLKHFTAAEMRASHPDRMIKEAVWGMLPKNNIARKMMTRVKVFAGPEHTHAAQKPETITL